MRILLLQSYLGRPEPLGLIFPIGLCYIASSLMDAHEVAVVDLNLCKDAYRELDDILTSFKPDVVGISLRNIDTTQKKDVFYYFKTVAPTAQAIKKALPDVKLMIGGAGFSMFAEEIMRRVPELDFGVYLEGEESTPELMRNLSRPEAVKGVFYRKGDKVVFTGARMLPDFAALAYPKRHFVNVKEYLRLSSNNIGIQTKRGCPLKCSYCSYPFLNGAKMRLRSAESVVDEIEYLMKEFNITGFTFVDSIFNVPNGHAESICREILRRGIKIRWDAWFEMRNFTDELALLVMDAGCVNAGFSPDAASNESLKALGKGLTEEDIYRVIGVARRAKKMSFGFGFFCTPPKQDFIGFLKMAKLYFMIPIQLFGRGSVSLGWVRVEPETRMRQISIDDGFIKKDDNLLPEDEEGLKRLFYSSPKTRAYADPFFSALVGFKAFARVYVRKILRRNTGQRSD